MLRKLFSGFEFEKEAKLYKKIGVTFFKKLVPTLGDFWINLYNKYSSKKVRFIKNRKSAIAWTRITIFIESIHILSFWAINYGIVNNLTNQNWTKVFILTFINILINLYPILIQRYNRIRMVQLFNININEVIFYRKKTDCNTKCHPRISDYIIEESEKLNTSLTE
jgi:hypothetical protein